MFWISIADDQLGFLFLKSISSVIKFSRDENVVNLFLKWRVAPSGGRIESSNWVSFSSLFSVNPSQPTCWALKWRLFNSFLYPSGISRSAYWYLLNRTGIAHSSNSAGIIYIEFSSFSSAQSSAVLISFCMYPSLETEFFVKKTINTCEERIADWISLSQIWPGIKF